MPRLPKIAAFDRRFTLSPVLPVVTLVCVTLLLASCADPARDRFEGAEKALLRQEMDAALAGFRSIPKEFPQSRYAPAALLRQGDLYGSYFRNYDAALEAYDSLVYNFPQSKEAPLAILHKGEIRLLQFFSYAKAAEELERLRARYPSFEKMDDALILLARAYGGMEDRERQSAVLASLLARNPDSPRADEARWMRATMLLAQGEYAAAEEAFRRILARAPDRRTAAHAHWGIAQAMEGSENYPGAIREYEAIRKDWEDPKYIREKIERLRKRKKPY
jgi:TolA-binding protein